MRPRRSAHKTELSSAHATNRSLFSAWSLEARFREQTLKTLSMLTTQMWGNSGFAISGRGGWEFWQPEKEFQKEGLHLTCNILTVSSLQSQKPVSFLQSFSLFHSYLCNNKKRNGTTADMQQTLRHVDLRCPFVLPPFPIKISPKQSWKELLFCRCVYKSIDNGPITSFTSYHVGKVNQRQDLASTVEIIPVRSG